MNCLQVEIYGDGPEKEELLECSKSCVRKGSVFERKILNKEVPSVLENLMFFVQTSFKESFGCGGREAHGYGVPVVVRYAEGFKK